MLPPHVGTSSAAAAEPAAAAAVAAFARAPEAAPLRDCAARQGLHR